MGTMDTSKDPANKFKIEAEIRKHPERTYILRQGFKDYRYSDREATVKELLEILKNHRYVVAYFYEENGKYVLNTCTFRDVK